MSDEEKVAKWALEGVFEPCRLLDQLAVDGLIAAAPEKLPQNVQELDEATFISLLQTNGSLPESWSEFGHGIYRSVAYLSNTPFFPQPTEATPTSLSIPGLWRGIAWIFPNIHHHLIGGSGGHSRSLADHRRLLFQCIATTTNHGQINNAKARERAARNAEILVQPSLINQSEIVVNFDEDGDEIYHDVLDFLVSYQPEHPIFMAGLPREAFRSLAKRLDNNLPRIHTLAIPRDQFVSFVTPLLALQFEHENPGDLALSEYEDAAKSITALFCSRGADKDYITWPDFDDGLKHVPFLFEPLYRILKETFLRRFPVSADVSEAFTKLTIPTDSFITQSLMSQLATMFYHNVDLESLERAHRWHKGIRPSAEVLLRAMSSMPDQTLLILSGVSVAGEEFIFGTFNPPPTDVELRVKEEESVWSGNRDEVQPVRHELDAIRDYIDYHSIVEAPQPVLVVLSPVHRVVRFNPRAMVEGDRLVFGDALKLLDDGTALIRDGDWEVTVTTKAIEIWGEIPSNA